MHKIIEAIRAMQELLHVTKPLMFDAVLFLWAAVEMGKFIWEVVWK